MTTSKRVIENLKEKYKQGLEHVVEHRKPTWRPDGCKKTDLSTSDLEEQNKQSGLIEGLPAGVLLGDLLKKFRLHCYRSKYHCVGHLNNKGFDCDIDRWTDIEENYDIPNNEDLDQISTILGLPTEQMLELRDAQLKHFRENITIQNIQALQNECKTWEHRICGMMWNSQLFHDYSLGIHPIIRNTLIFSSGSIHCMNQGTKKTRQCATLEVLWQHWSEENNEMLLQNIESEMNVATKHDKNNNKNNNVKVNQYNQTKRDQPSITVSYTITEDQKINSTIVMGPTHHIENILGKTIYENYISPISLQFDPHKISSTAVPHTLISMIEYIKTYIIDLDLCEQTGENKHHINRVQHQKYIDEIEQFDNSYTLYVKGKDFKICKKPPDVAIKPNSTIFIPWSQDKSILVQEYEIHPFGVKYNGEYILACNRPLPLEWWMFYIESETSHIVR